MQGCQDRALATHPLVCDICSLLLGCASLDLQHIYCKANSAADWVVSFVAHHSDGGAWNDTSVLPISFQDIFFSDHLG